MLQRTHFPSGWDAELYRNGTLRAYQADRGDGRYEFPDIELQFGENDFEFVLYCPQGQIRRERTSQNVGIESLPSGKTWYWGGIVDEGRDLIGLGSSGYQTQTGLRWGVGVERGLDKRTTAGFGYHSLTRSGRRRHYLEASVRRSLGPVLVEVSGAQQFGAGRALPPLVGVIAFLYLYGESGMATRLVGDLLRIEGAPWRLTGPGAILLVHTYSMYVYFYLFTRAALARFDGAQLEAAASLGAGRLRTFTRVVLPGLAPALAAAAILP